MQLNYFWVSVNISGQLTHYYNPSGECVPSWSSTVYSVHVCYAQRPFFGQISMWNVKSPNTGASYETGGMV